MWHTGKQWQAGENTVQESLSKETLATLAADPNFTMSAGKRKKEDAGLIACGAIRKKPKPAVKEERVAAPDAQGQPSRERA